MSKKMIQIAVLNGDLPLSKEERHEWERLGKIHWVDQGRVFEPQELTASIRNADYLAFDPGVLGGFEGLEPKLKILIKAAKKLKGLALDTTAFGYIPQYELKSKKIVVTHVPKYSTESVAEHVLLMMLGAAKRAFISDRATQRGSYELIEGKELANKTLGVIGLGHIGTRVAELGRAVGMNIIGWNRSEKYIPGVQQVEIDTLLQQSDFISLHLAENTETHHFLSKKRISKLKQGVIIINTADRSLVDEAALAKSLLEQKIDTYVLEAEDLSSGPLATCSHAILLKSFGWFTTDALVRNKRIWLENVKSMIDGKPKNIVDLN